MIPVPVYTTDRGMSTHLVCKAAELGCRFWVRAFEPDEHQLSASARAGYLTQPVYWLDPLRGREPSRAPAAGEGASPEAQRQVAFTSFVFFFFPLHGMAFCGSFRVYCCCIYTSTFFWCTSTNTNILPVYWYCRYIFIYTTPNTQPAVL